MRKSLLAIVGLLFVVMMAMGCGHGNPAAPTPSPAQTPTLGTPTGPFVVGTINGFVMTPYDSNNPNKGVATQIGIPSMSGGMLEVKVVLNTPGTQRVATSLVTQTRIGEQYAWASAEEHAVEFDVSGTGTGTLHFPVPTAGLLYSVILSNRGSISVGGNAVVLFSKY